MFVTFYGEGPYWDNLVMLPAYPTGYSYPRPFRYHDKWVQPQLVDRIRAEPASFVGQNAVLAMRFRTSGSDDRFVPLRQVQITAVAREDDNFVYFRLRRFVDLADVRSLGDAALPLPPNVDEVAVNGTTRRLFFEADLPEPRFANAKRDAELWGKVTELISAEAHLPVADEARKAVFFHFRTPARDKPASVGEVASSWTSGSQYGASLPEAMPHELVVLHRIPHLIGTEGSIQPVNADVAGVNFETAPMRVQLSGNYGRNVITVTGRRPSAEWETVDLRPVDVSTKSAADEQINLVPLSIPVRSTRSMLYRLRRYWFPAVILALALGTQGLVGEWETVAKHPELWLVIFVAAAVGSSAVLSIRRDE